MKKRIPTFLAGMLTMALVGSLGVGALAATGSFTITVDPINIQVNGATFVPKNEKGEEVPVFAYDGTTYAPLRALAEAYGLEVGYDAQANMATVGETAPEPSPEPSPELEKLSYEEFKAMWEVKDAEIQRDYNWHFYTVNYIGGLSVQELADLAKVGGKDRVGRDTYWLEYMTRWVKELYVEGGKRIGMNYYYPEYSPGYDAYLGWGYAAPDECGAEFAIW